jgi:hypothetical protein
MRTNTTNIPASRAIYSPSEATTFSAMNPGESVTYSVTPLPRQFRPGSAQIYFPSGLYSGVSVSQVAITGAALTGYTATYTLFNDTSSIITPTAQTVVIYQTA